jgi:hypothetical protein
MLIKLRHLVLYLTLLITACSLNPKHSPQLIIKSRSQDFHLQKSSKVKIAILPLRDFSGHFGAGYAHTAMDTFTKEIKHKFPQLELADPETIADLMQGTGNEKDYNLFVNKCITDNKYCIEPNELLQLFKDSGIDYVVSITIGTLILPVPGSIIGYHLSALVYDINQGGQIVYDSFAEGEIYADVNEGAASYLMDIIKEISREIVTNI